MYWMSRPPYWRWLAACAVIAIAAYMDVTGPATESYPFTAQAAAAGDAVAVEWREVPTGVLPPADELGGIARRAIAAGTPLVAGLLEPVTAPPPDWWAVPADLPGGVTAGTELLVAAVRPELHVMGIVVAPPGSSGFGGPSAGLIALPGEHAAAVAAALSEGRATILIRP